MSRWYDRLYRFATSPFQGNGHAGNGKAGLNGAATIDRARVEAILTDDPMARNYRPTRSSAWWSSNSSTPNMQQFYADLEAMLAHPRVDITLKYYKAGIAGMKPVFKASSPEVQKFVEEEWNNFFTRGRADVQRAYEYGRVGLEIVYEEKDDLLRFKNFEPFNPLECTVLTRDHVYVGFRVSGLREQEGLWGPQKVPAKGFWMCHNRRFNKYYGLSQCYAAWRPWRRLAANDGGEDITDGSIYRHGLKPSIGRFPMDDNEARPALYGATGQFLSNRDKMLEMLESLKSGGNIAFSSRRDQNGQYLWDVTFPDHALDVSGFISYCENLEQAISLGIGVPPELLEASEVGSGYSGRAIPMEGFLDCQQADADRLLWEWGWQIATPLVKWNFGEDAWFDGEVPSLKETLLKKPGEDQQPPPGMQPPGGQPQPPMGFATERAPHGGVTIGGKEYTGGEFIPGDVIAKATPAEKAAINGKGSKGKNGKKGKADLEKVLSEINDGIRVDNHLSPLYDSQALAYGKMGPYYVDVAESADEKYAVLARVIEMVGDEQYHAEELAKGGEHELTSFLERNGVSDREIKDLLSVVANSSKALDDGKKKLEKLAEKVKHAAESMAGHEMSGEPIEPPEPTEPNYPDDDGDTEAMAAYKQEAELYEKSHSDWEKKMDSYDVAMEKYTKDAEHRDGLVKKYDAAVGEFYDAYGMIANEYQAGLSKADDVLDGILGDLAEDIEGELAKLGKKAKFATASSVTDWTEISPGKWRSETLGETRHQHSKPGTGNKHEAPGAATHKKRKERAHERSQAFHEEQAKKVKEARKQAILSILSKAKDKALIPVGAGKALAKAGYDKLPGPAQKAVDWIAWGGKKLEHVAMIGFTKSKQLAAQVARETGKGEEHVERVARICAVVDLSLAWTVNFPLVTAATGNPLLGKASSWIPVASLGYLATASVKNPLRVLRAAKKVLMGQTPETQRHATEFSTTRRRAIAMAEQEVREAFADLQAAQRRYDAAVLRLAASVAGERFATESGVKDPHEMSLHEWLFRNHRTGKPGYTPKPDNVLADEHMNAVNEAEEAGQFAQNPAMLKKHRDDHAKWRQQRGKEPHEYWLKDYLKMHAGKEPEEDTVQRHYESVMGTLKHGNVDYASERWHLANLNQHRDWQEKREKESRKSKDEMPTAEENAEYEARYLAELDEYHKRNRTGPYDKTKRKGEGDDGPDDSEEADWWKRGEKKFATYRSWHDQNYGPHRELDDAESLPDVAVKDGKHANSEELHGVIGHAFQNISQFDVDGLVKIPRMYNYVKKTYPKLSRKEFHDALQDMYKSNKLDLHVINEVRTVNEDEGIRDGDNLYYFVSESRRGKMPVAKEYRPSESGEQAAPAAKEPSGEQAAPAPTKKTAKAAKPAPAPKQKAAPAEPTKKPWEYRLHDYLKIHAGKEPEHETAKRHSDSFYTAMDSGELDETSDLATQHDTDHAAYQKGKR